MSTMAKPKKRKTSRIAGQHTLNNRLQIEQAAKLCGISVEQFVDESAALRAADILGEAHLHRRLTNADAEFLIDLKENPPPLNDRLLRALRSNKRSTRG